MKMQKKFKVGTVVTTHDSKIREVIKVLQDGSLVVQKFDKTEIFSCSPNTVKRATNDEHLRFLAAKKQYQNNQKASSLQNQLQKAQVQYSALMTYGNAGIGGTGGTWTVQPNQLQGLNANGVWIDEIAELKEVKKKKKKINKVNLKELDKLVLSTEVKGEIVALIQQHKNADKLFKTWGLGQTIEYGRGMTMMFYGLPGTGKTWGANCIAKALGKELLVIGAAEIQTQEPGGANRNIQQAFSEAKAKGKVLFIDECDSLICSRANLGMILASEINTLLTEIERFEGVCILASNRIEDMDSALERRLQLIVEFPLPTLEQRVDIWKLLLPKKLPLNEDVKIEELAIHEISGGLIKNAVLQSARLALAANHKNVNKSHFQTAIERIKSSSGLMGKTRVQHQTQPNMTKKMSDFLKI